MRSVAHELHSRTTFPPSQPIPAEHVALSMMRTVVYVRVMAAVSLMLHRQMRREVEP